MGALLPLQEQYRILTYEIVSNLVLNRINACPELVTEAMRTVLLQSDHQGIIYHCLNCPQTELVSEHGRDILRKFLLERSVLQPLRRVLDQGERRTYVENFPDLLEPVSKPTFHPKNRLKLREIER
jgi:hypothetical protein